MRLPLSTSAGAGVRFNPFLRPSAFFLPSPVGLTAPHVVAWSPDHATRPDRRSPKHKRRPAVGAVAWSGDRATTGCVRFNPFVPLRSFSLALPATSALGYTPAQRTAGWQRRGSGMDGQGGPRVVLVHDWLTGMRGGE